MEFGAVVLSGHPPDSLKKGFDSRNTNNSSIETKEIHKC
jgi:hypothetical protein